MEESDLRCGAAFKLCVFQLVVLYLFVLCFLSKVVLTYVDISCTRQTEKMSALSVLQVPTGDGVVPESPRQAKNGVAYEMIYKPATGQKPPESPRMPVTNAERSANRLKEAEDRRVSLEAAKIEAVKARMEKIDAAREKRREEENIFIQETKEELERDMSLADERRENYLNDIKSRVNARLDRVKKCQEYLAQRCVELEADINQKLTEAEGKRTARIAEVQERAQEHLLHVKEVMVAADALAKDSEEKIASEMDRALKNREVQMSAMLKRLQDHSAKVERLRRERAAVAAGMPTPQANDEPMQCDDVDVPYTTPKRH